MSTKNEAIASAMELWVQAQYEQTPLISILNITEQGVNVKFGAIYGEDETTVSRLVMFVKGLQDFIDTKENIQLDTTTSLDYVLLEIQGKINLDQVAKLTSIVEVPGGEYLDALNEN